jgi:hypothetical protein
MVIFSKVSVKEGYRVAVYPLPLSASKLEFAVHKLAMVTTMELQEMHHHQYVPKNVM